MDNTEKTRECRCCGNESENFICDDCKKVFLKNNIININSEGDYDWYIWNVDDFIQRKIQQEICSNNI